jgi:hypothetical protein
MKGTYECWNYTVGVCRWSSVPVLRDLLLAGIPDQSIVGTADGEEGLEDTAVEISLDIFLGVLAESEINPTVGK